MAGKAKAAQARQAFTVEEAYEVGFFGQEVDPTPDEHYTVAGQLAGKPVPESDPELKAQAKEAAGLAEGGEKS